MSIIDVFVAVIIALMLRCDSLEASKDSWPSGSYSLPKPLSGCPKLWKEGWLKQHLEDDAKTNETFRSKFSSNFYMNASIIEKEFVVRTFCTKVTDTIVWNPWPKGFYCIYRKHYSCPDDMVEGSIHWDDEDNDNSNDEGGSLPDGDFGRNTKLYYCCQNQGKWYRLIELPTEKPFYLLPYESRNCQRVKWAISSLQYIIYDTEDDRNEDTFIGDHVFTDELQSLPKIFYCYYKGCQYKLQNDNGSFTSPNFQNNSYPDFQICSWLITVNASLRILLKLQTINIPNCEENYLDIYNGRRDNASTLLARFCCENATSGAKVTSKMNNLYVVLKSGNNSARNTEDSSESLGFYAEYEAFQQGPLPTHPTTLSSQKTTTTTKGNETGPLATHPTTISSQKTTTMTKGNETDKACSNDTSCGTEWYIVVVSLVSGIIIGILLYYIVWCSHRRWFTNRKAERNPEPQTTEVDTTYQELDLSKMNTEENYQSLTVNAESNDAGNDDDTTYSELSKTRDVENNYQSLT